jgi:hypothetical protein
MNSTLKGFLGGLALAAILALGTTCAHAAPADNAKLLDQWAAHYDHCRGDQIEPLKNPECKAAGAIARMLYARSWFLSPQDVWYSTAQVDAVQDRVLSLLPTDSVAGMHKRLLADGVTDEAFVAIYNFNRERIQAMSPLAWAMMSELAHWLEVRNPNDPRFALDQ